MSNAGSFGSSGGGGGGVSSVSGTANRITSTGGTTPVIDIDTGYVGQTSLTTLGTITTGTWNGSTIDVSHGGTGDASLTAYAVLCGGTTSTGNVQSVSGVGTSGQVLTSNGAGLLPTWQAASGGVTSVTGTTNRITSSGGSTPVIDISSSYVGQSSITTLGTIATGVWNGTSVDLAHGGTNANLTASNGGIFYSTGSAGAILAGTATANQVLLSGSSTTPAWSTATYPATATGTGTILRANGTNWVASTATYPNTATSGDLLYASGSNVVGNLAIGSTNQVVVVSSGVPSYGDDWERLVQISKQTPSSQASIVFTSGISSTYGSYLLVIRGMVLSGNVDFDLQMSTNGGSSYDSGANYAWIRNYWASDSNSDFTRAAADTQIKIIPATGGGFSTSTDSINIRMYLYDLASASLFKSTMTDITVVHNSISYRMVGSGSYNSATAVNAFKLYTSSGSFSGTVTLYGIVEP